MSTAPKSVIWVKDQRRIVPDHRIRRVSPTHLKILVFQREDSGLYQCYVYNDWESSQAHVQLDLKEEMPTFIRVFPDQIHMPGQMISLHCSASGSPIPQILWFLDGEQLSESRRVKTGDYVHMDGSVISYVNITDLAVSDGGLYGCEAQNDVGLLSHSARIDVFGSPYIRPMGNLTVVAGTTVSIRCPVSGYPIDRTYIEKSGSKLPYGDRQTVDQRGVVRIHNVRKEDEGIYRCIATNGRGEKAERPLVLKVVTAPLISPFSFSESLEEGMRSSIICSVIAGDPPISLTWYRNSRLLKETSPDIQIVPITDFVSSLIINHVSRHHSGNYTCFASNSAAATNYTATMIVKAPPVWVIKPSDQSALEGMSVTFDCQAEGQPRPVVRWKFGKEDGSLQSILSSSHIHVLENGSLTITVAQKGDAGYYMCETSNDVGEPLRYSVRLAVHSAPQIQTSTQVVHVRKSEEARFSCSASGDPPLNIVWSREGFPLSLYPENRYITRESDGRGAKISEVIIKSSQRKDSDVFTCSASNPFGEDKTTVRLVVQEPPDPPQDLKPLEVTSNSISLSWTPGHPGNNPITSYIITYRPDIDKWPDERSKRVVVSSADTSATIASLRPVTTYHIYVNARNGIGQSLPSSELSVTTNAEAPRTPPRHVKAIPLDSSSIRISWQQQPSFMEQVSYVDGYYVGFRELPGGGPYVYKTVNNKHGQSDANYTLVGLKRGTQYSIVVQAFNSQGAGPPSDEVIVQTSTIDPPDAPIVRFTDTTATSVNLNWEAKSTNERPISGFILTYKGSSGQWHETRLPASRQSFVLENLQCGTSYQIVLTAYNSVGHGEPSEMQQVVTNGRAPVAPEKNDFLRSNTTSVQLNLKNWMDDGCPISHLVIQYKPQGQKEWILVSNHILTDQEMLMIADLSPGTWHDLLVTAHSDAGTTDAEYRFATLTLTGATVPPLSVTRHHHFFEDPTILVPIVCAVVVLIVIISVTAFVVVWKRRDPAGEAPSDIYSRGSGGRADDISMSSYGKAKGNSVYDSQREPLYYPLPYATTHIPNHHVPEQITESPEQSLQRSRGGGRMSEHTYDIPQRVQLHHNVPLHQYSQLWANSRGFAEKSSLMVPRGEIEDFDVAIAMAEKYAAFRLSQTRAYEAILMESSGWSLVVTQLSPNTGIPRWLSTNDSENMTEFHEGICDNMVEYDDGSLDEELSETECDRDCNSLRRQRKYIARSYSRVGAVIAC
nr:Down syndrome cell adhesion molecule homolog [Parasteatoda tepidariorum]